MLSEAEVEKHLNPDLLLSVTERTLADIAMHRALVTSPATIHIDDDDGTRAFKAMAGALPSRNIAGVKWVGAFDRNRERGLPRAPATIIVTDCITGRLVGVVSATGLTAWRTAAVAVISAKYCAVTSPSHAAVLGFGAIGKAAAQLLSVAFPLTEIAIWEPNFAKARANTEMLRRDHNIEIRATKTVEDAVANAEIVITAAGLSANAPFLRRSMIRNDVFISCLGSYQEIDDDVILAADTLIVDDWDAATKRGNLAPSIKGGLVTRNMIHSDLAETIAANRRTGRRREGISVASLTGLGVLDVALAASVLEDATAIVE